MKPLRISGATWCVAGISLWFWICAGLIAMCRPFWFDELVTWHVARLPTIAAIWSALHAGVDQNLLLSHLCVRLSHAVFGYSHLATRLPALAGFWIMLAGIYLFLKRRLPTPYALIGMVFPMLTYAWAYAFEARSYGIMLGGAAIALASWQAAAEGRHRLISLIGIAVGLSAALASHYAAVLLAVPFTLGEGVRSFDRRKLDLSVWIAFAAAAPVTLIYPGLLAATRDWALGGLQPDATSFSGFYSAALRQAITPLLLASIVGIGLARGRKNEPQAPALPRHETAALLGFVLAPMLFIAVVVNRHLVFTARYGILCVIGLAGCSAAAMFRATFGNRRAATAALLVLGAWLAAARGKDVRNTIGNPRLQFERENPVLVQAAQSGVPLVVPDALAFLAADFYLRSAPLERIHYPIGPERVSGHDFFDHLVDAAARTLPLRVRADSWSDVASRRQPFLLYTDEHQTPWMSDVLLREGWLPTLRAHQGMESLFEVAPPR